MPYLLVIEQIQYIEEQVESSSEALGYKVRVEKDIKRSLLFLQQRFVNAIVLDLALYEVIHEEIQAASINKNLNVIVISEVENDEIHRKSRDLGAILLIKNAEINARLKRVLSQTVESFYRDRYGLESSKQPRDFGYFVGKSSQMEQLYFELERVAKTEIPVLIIGESGTGKELAALTIHEYSLRKEENFLPVNCGAISTHLIESELFGHEKGSFTGADRARQGYFELADKGTLFLDEITEMPLDMQVRLLRVLETGQFMRVGGSKLFTSTARIVGATNRDPIEAIEKEKLREDLYYRLNVFPLVMPPLRDRGEDILLLANDILHQVNEQYKTEKYFSKESLRKMMGHHWPGNVRELRNVVWRSYILTEGDEIDVMIRK